MEKEILDRIDQLEELGQEVLDTELSDPRCEVNSGKIRGFIVTLLSFIARKIHKKGSFPIQVIVLY